MKVCKLLACGVLVSLLAFPAFAGGQQEAPEDGKPDTLNIIALDIDVTQFGPAVEQFENDHGIEVEWLEYPYGDLWNQITTSITGGTTIDLYMMSNSWHPELAELGMAVPLSDVASDEEIAEVTDKYYDVTVEFMTSHGEMWGLPNTASSVSFFYNETMLNELGYSEPPATWDEMLQISREAIDEGLASYGFFPGWLTNHEDGMVQFDIMMKLHDGEWMDEDRTEFTFNDEAGVEALTLMRDILDEGLVPRAALETSDWDNFHYFLAGDQPFEMNWNFVYEEVIDPERSDIVDDWAVAPIPGIERETYTVLGGGGYAISPTSRSPEWAYTLLTYMTDEVAAEGVMQQQGGAEATIEAMYDSPVIDEYPDDEYPLARPFRDQMDYAGLRPSHFLTWYSEFRDNIFTPAMHSALLGNMSPEEALDQAQEEAQQMLESEGL